MSDCNLLENNMRALFDTSVVIAALVESHPMHERAFPWLKQAREKQLELIVASHTLAELYAVLSTLPLKPRISSSVAWRLIKENIESISKVISLTPADYSSTIKSLSEMGVIGGTVYDALIAKVAKKAKVERLITLNIDHFKRVWQDGQNKIIAP